MCRSGLPRVQRSIIGRINDNSPLWRSTESRALMHGDEDLTSPLEQVMRSRNDQESKHISKPCRQDGKRREFVTIAEAVLQQQRNSSRCYVCTLLLLDYSRFPHGWLMQSSLRTPDRQVTCMNRSMPPHTFHPLPCALDRRARQWENKQQRAQRSSE